MMEQIADAVKTLLVQHAPAADNDVDIEVQFRYFDPAKGGVASLANYNGNVYNAFRAFTKPNLVMPSKKRETDNIIELSQ